MGPAPSSWGTGPHDAPPSITPPGQMPRPMRDAATGPDSVPSSGDGTDVGALFDDTSMTQVSFAAADPTIQVRFTAGAPEVLFYTLTSSDAQADPTGWALEGSNDGTSWTVLDERREQTFRWRSQTRPFKVCSPGAYTHYRLRLEGAAGMTLAEVELLARPAH
jgi:hypothetical protein